MILFALRKTLNHISRKTHLLGSAFPLIKENIPENKSAQELFYSPVPTNSYHRKRSLMDMHTRMHRSIISFSLSFSLTLTRQITVFRVIENKKLKLLVTGRGRMGRTCAKGRKPIWGYISMVKLGKKKKIVGCEVHLRNFSFPPNFLFL